MPTQRPGDSHQPTDVPPTPRPQLPADAHAYADATPDAETAPPTVISTFSGPGGSSIGYERAGCDVIAAVDAAPSKFTNAIPATYRANHPDTTFLERDITELDASELLDAAGRDVGDVDVLDGSPPCAPFSGANSRQDWDEHEFATLFDEYVRLVDGIEPKAFVAENVPQLAQGKTKGYFNLLTERLRNAGPGYTLTVYKFDAAALGAGHHRRRLIFIGTRDDQPDPPPLGPSTCYQPRRVADSWVNVPNTDHDLAVATAKLTTSKNYHAYTRIKPGDALADVADGKGWSHYRFKALDPAPTFTTRPTICQPPTVNRAITIPELRRLIGIPDDYHLATDDVPDDDYQTAWQLCTRCLPPELTETIGRALRAHVLSPGAFAEAESTTIADKLTTTTTTDDGDADADTTAAASCEDGESDALSDFSRRRFVDPHRSAILMARQQDRSPQP